MLALSYNNFYLSDTELCILDTPLEVSIIYYSQVAHLFRIYDYLNKLLLGELETRNWQNIINSILAAQVSVCPYSELETLHSCETKQHPPKEAQAAFHVMLDKNGNSNTYYKLSSML